MKGYCQVAEAPNLGGPILRSDRHFIAEALTPRDSVAMWPLVRGAATSFP